MLRQGEAKTITDALSILGRVGGSILSTPGEHRRWKISTDDCVCNSTSLIRACRMLVEWWVDEEEGVL